jgi:cytochrome oxidase Cu insertion factor (SCO1/SenC/PrrC family)
MTEISTSAGRSGSSAFSTTWRWVLLLFPIAIAGGLLLLRQVEVNALRQRPLGAYGVVPAFQLTNQEGQPYGSANLAGRIWIADFIFTSCAGPCPIISSRMSELQKPLRDTDVHLISFTVDPDKDTPAVLRDYAGRLHASPDRWDFLTGSKKAIYDISLNGFKLGIADGSEEAGVPVHSTRMVLVDRKGIIRGYYDALAPDGVTKVLADASHLLREQPR